MYLRDLVRSVVTRWYFVLAGLLATAGLSAAAYFAVPVSYDTQASMLLLPPKSSVGARGNPYLYLGGLGQAVEVLSARMNADRVAKPLVDDHPSVDFTMGPDITTTGPILLIKVTAPSEAEAMAVMSALVDLVPPTLEEMQDGLSIPTRSRIDVMTLVTSSGATPDTQTRDRAVIVVGAVGTAGTLLLTGLADSLLKSRRPRRQAPSPAGNEGDDVEPNPVTESPDSAGGDLEPEPTYGTPAVETLADQDPTSSVEPRQDSQPHAEPSDGEPPTPDVEPLRDSAAGSEISAHEDDEPTDDR